MHLPKQGTLTRGLLAYIAGFVVLSAGLAITEPLSMAALHRILEQIPAKPGPGWAMFGAVMTLDYLINAIPFFLAGLCIGWLIRRRALLHGLAFGLGIAALGLLIVLTFPYREALGAPFFAVFVVLALIGIIASGLGGAVSALLTRARARQPA
jgi:MFS family permease